MIVKETEWTHCPIWNTPARVNRFEHDTLTVDSARAGGRYVISDKEAAAVSNLDDTSKALLTSWLIRNRNAGNLGPRVSVQLAKGLSRLAVHMRADYLLKYIESELSSVGDSIEIHSLVVPDADLNDPSWKRIAQMLACSESLDFEDLIFLLDYLEAQAWLQRIRPIRYPWRKYNLTVDGYSYIAELEKQFTDSTQAFVAMWFHPSLEDAWGEGFKPAIEDAGYTALRIDKKEHMNKIDDEIIAEIRRSKFLIADFTEGNAGTRGSVYYEAGFAHGLNIPVIFTCREDSFEKIHFDTRQYSHIVWRNPEELRLLLTRRISAVLGDGPKKADAADSH